MPGRPIISDRDHPQAPPGGAGEAPHLPYRPDVDGLRAVAVLSVVLYHFGVPGLGGGYVGVDVFFVISGFLIGGLLWKELSRSGSIALGRFYLRRVRRLAPAFFAMAAVSAAMAWVVLLPFELREFGKELIASTLWLSNLLFYRGAGYFDIGADAKVLLHTWSLSVEEQFYIFLPLFLLLLRFSRRGLLAALVLVWAASAVASIALTPTAPIATFYLFPFRAWELLSGVLLAIGLHQRPDWRRQGGAAGWAGLALIIGAAALTRADGFPGWQALFPVTGSLLVLANGGGAAARLLSLRGPVFIGLISYSLYLWHWPVLILSRYWRDGYAGPVEVFGWLALAFTLAIASWALVERPVRRGRAVTTPVLLGGSVAAGVAMLGLGALAWLGGGLPDRFAPAARPHIAASSDFIQDWSRCNIADEGPLAGLNVCAIGPDAPPQVLIWGDSHLRALMDGLALAADETATPGIIVWHAGCPPLFGLDKRESAATPAEDAACTAANATMRAALPALDGIERVLLVGRWTYFADGTGVGRDVHNTIALYPQTGSGLAADDQAGLFAAALDATVTELSRHFDRVYILRQIPEVANYDSRDVARRLAHGRLTAIEADALTYAVPEALAARVMRAEAALMPLVAAGRVTLIDPWTLLCLDRCSVVHDGQVLYFDNNHLTNAGAIALRGLFVPFLTGTPAP